MSRLTFEHEKDRFPFPKEQLSVSRFAIVPNVCYELGLRISPCLGIGMQNITITDERQNNQQYGHSVYEARLGKFTGGGFTGGLLLDYFEIEETRNGIESKTSVRLVMITLGYILDF